MFAVEVGFSDELSQPEMVLVRRPQALIGASELAHVVIDDLEDLGYQLRLVRDIGERFEVSAIRSSESVVVPDGIEGIHEGSTTLDLGKTVLVITPLCADLLVREGEPPDRSGVRILRRACLEPAPLFPAVLVAGDAPMVVSFPIDQGVFIGRAKQCLVRLDSADISAKHARIGYEDGEFWIEDLGSTNGTFVNGQQISGRTAVAPAVPIILGRELAVYGVTSEDQVIGVVHSQPTDLPPSVISKDRYPVLLSVSSVPRPARLVFPVGQSIAIGRDPTSDIWLGAPHVSRTHCTLTLNDFGELVLTDYSTNGTGHDTGLLRKGETLSIVNHPKVLDFGGGITLAICFSEAHEQEFVAANGALSTFSSNGPIVGSSVGSTGVNPVIGSEIAERYPLGEYEDGNFSANFTPLERLAVFYQALPKTGKIALFSAVVAALAVFGLVLLLALGLLK